LGKPLIQPVGPEDQGANPSDEQTQVHLVALKFTPSEEILAVADSLERWLPDHPDDTVAVLVPRNLRAGDLVAELEQRKLPYHDGLLRSSRSTRLSAGTLGNLLRYLADPGSSSKMATVYKVWRRADRDDDQQKLLMERTSELLRKCRHVEDFVWPRPDQDWLAELGLAESSPETHEQLLEFRELLRRWQEAILLPVDQITLTLAQDLFSEPTELAIAHKLAVLLRQANNLHPEWRLPELTQELAVIARNERRFLGFSEDDRGFDPKKHRGQVVISTMHKAKGLEWDRVYLMSVNNYDFPSGSPGDYYIAEKWFIRDDLNLEAEALGQLDALLERDEYDWYQEGQASQKARLDYVRERLRLLYVSITRARKELVITWNTGRRGDMLAAMPFLELLSFWESKLQKAAD
jgi:DNA helicase-2/ATP-dependent DNA helicase PcrA